LLDIVGVVGECGKAILDSDSKCSLQGAIVSKSLRVDCRFARASDGRAQVDADLGNDQSVVGVRRTLSSSKHSVGLEVLTTACEEVVKLLERSAVV
jgi:hypothetical protein